MSENIQYCKIQTSLKLPNRNISTVVRRRNPIPFFLFFITTVITYVQANSLVGLGAPHLPTPLHSHSLTHVERYLHSVLHCMPAHKALVNHKSISYRYIPNQQSHTSIHSLTHSLSTVSQSVTHSQRSHSHIVTVATQSLSVTHSLTHPQSLTLSHSLTVTHSQSLTHSHSLSVTLSQSVSQSVSQCGVQRTRQRERQPASQPASQTDCA